MKMAERLTLVECPRDAMQGIKAFIPTQLKIKYLTTLLNQGFDVLDCGSFVNPESIPQMADTAEVVQAISEIETQTKLLVIVANERGALRAVAYPKIKYLGFPLSVSETFQRRNTNASRDEAFRRLARIQDIAVASGKEVVCYLSMAFGNPYGDLWSASEVAEWASSERFHYRIRLEVLIRSNWATCSLRYIINYLTYKLEFTYMQNPMSGLRKYKPLMSMAVEGLMLLWEDLEDALWQKMIW
jgi:hydroxymethylglutaryl-CoA lyase